MVTVCPPVVAAFADAVASGSRRFSRIASADGEQRRSGAEMSDQAEHDVDLGISQADDQPLRASI